MGNKIQINIRKGLLRGGVSNATFLFALGTAIGMNFGQTSVQVLPKQSQNSEVDLPK